MKLQIILAVCGFIMATTAQEQVTVKSPSSNHKIEFRRCIQTDDDALIDFMITNISNVDIVYSLQNIQIYDDEGNVHTDGNRKGRPLFSSTDNRLSPNVSATIPVGGFSRVRIIVSGGFDQYATKVILLKMNFGWRENDSPFWDSIELRNFPIIRE